MTNHEQSVFQNGYDSYLAKIPREDNWHAKIDLEKTGIIHKEAQIWFQGWQKAKREHPNESY